MTSDLRHLLSRQTIKVLQMFKGDPLSRVLPGLEADEVLSSPASWRVGGGTSWYEVDLADEGYRVLGFDPPRRRLP